MIDEDVDQELRARLNRALAGQELNLDRDPTPAIRRRVDDRRERRQRGTRTALAAAVLIVVVSMTLIATARRGDSDGQRVDTVDPATTAAEPSTPSTPAVIPPASTGAVVPDLLGMTLAEAQAIAAGQGFKAGAMTFEDGQPASDPDFPFGL